MAGQLSIVRCPLFPKYQHTNNPLILKTKFFWLHGIIRNLTAYFSNVCPVIGTNSTPVISLVV